MLVEDEAMLFGVPGETRTPTNGFGDRNAAITPPRHILRVIKLFYNIIF